MELERPERGALITYCAPSDTAFDAGDRQCGGGVDAVAAGVPADQLGDTSHEQHRHEDERAGCGFPVRGASWLACPAPGRAAC